MHRESTIGTEFPKFFHLVICIVFFSDSFLYNCISKDGMTALMFASLIGHVEVVDTLLQHESRVDLQNKVSS